jgi:hypothetical protein
MRTYSPSPSVRTPAIPLYLGLERSMRKSFLGASGASEAVGLTAAAAPVGISAAANARLITGMAVPVIGAAVAVLASIVGGLLAAHAQRAADAKNENQAADSASQTFDQVIQAIVSAYNGGTASVAQCQSSLQQMQSTMLQTLQSKVGPPGTAWTKNPPGQCAGTACNSGCTVGCCLYYNDLVPGICSMTQALNAMGTSLSQAQSLAASFPLPASVSGSNGVCTSFTMTIPEIYPSKYSDYSRPSYQVTLTMPAVSSAVAGAASAVASPAVSAVGGSSIGGGSLLPLIAIAGLAYLLI